MTNETTATELRTAVRFPLRLPIAITTSGEHHQAETQNISAGGVLFNLELDMTVGSPIEFAIEMPAAVLGASTDVTVTGVGRVVRCDVEDGHRAIAAVIDEYHFERR